MNKELYTRRIETFKREFPNYATSEVGNIYTYLNESTREFQIHNDGFSTTKNQLSKLGTVNKFTKRTYSSLLMITTKGKLLFKPLNGRFQTLTLTQFVRLCRFGLGESLTNQVANVFFIGRKYDYLIKFPDLWRYKMFQNCSSLKEGKIVLGFESIPDLEFVKLFSLYDLNLDIINLLYFSDNKYNLVSLFNKILKSNVKKEYTDKLGDYINMFPMAQPYKIPKGLNSLTRLHDEKVLEANVGV